MSRAKWREPCRTVGCRLRLTAAELRRVLRQPRDMDVVVAQQLGRCGPWSVTPDKLVRQISDSVPKGVWAGGTALQPLLALAAFLPAILAEEGMGLTLVFGYLVVLRPSRISDTGAPRLVWPPLR